MKGIKTLLKENDFKQDNEYYNLILTKYNKGNHLKCSQLFQDLKRKEKEFFLCNYLAPDTFKRVGKFFVIELINI